MIVFFIGSNIEKYISSIARYQNDIALIKLSKDVEINGQFLSNSFPFSQFQLIFLNLLPSRQISLSQFVFHLPPSSAKNQQSMPWFMLQGEDIETLRHWGNCHQFAIISIAIVIVLFSSFSTCSFTLSQMLQMGSS